MLRQLPFDYPDNLSWKRLGEFHNTSTDYPFGKLRWLANECAGPLSDDYRPDYDLPGELRYILLFLAPAEDLANAMTAGNWFRKPRIAHLWLTSITDAAWTVWLEMDLELPW